MDQEQDNEKQKALARHIANLEMEISTWGAHNSQSNPGAVMELRDMKRDLAAAYKEFHATIVAAVRTRKPGETAAMVGK
jgi:hypothetical protein